MVVRGRVQNGVVVMEGGDRFPEGQEVTVVASVLANEKRSSILDIPPVSLGVVLKEFSNEGDLLAEMLEGRR